MDLDLIQTLRIVRRRWWILALAVIITSGSAYFMVSRETPLYQATAVFLVNPGALIGSSEYSTLQDSQRLTETYTELVKSQSMRDRVATVVGEGEISASDVSVSTVDDTLLIRVTVTDESPETAALTANTFVTEFQDFIYGQNQTRLNQSRTQVDSQIEFLNTQIAELDQQIPNADADELPALQQQRQTYVGMVAQLENDAARISMQTGSSSPFVEQVDQAKPPTEQSSPNVLRTTLLGGLAGLVLGAAILALLEYLDRTVKTYGDIAGIVEVPLLATVPLVTEAKGKRGDKQLLTLSRPQSHHAESIRLLRTNLSFASIEQPLHSLVVSSALPNEGKSTVAASLAVAAAQAGNRVMLVDADLRKPSQAEIFGERNRSGISNIISDPSRTWQSVAFETYVNGLSLISSGPIPPNPSEMISSTRFRDLIQDLKSKFDLVVIDSPPILGASDALMVGSVADGMLFVVHAGQTRIDSVGDATKLIEQSGSRVVGVVLNRTKDSSSSYIGGYYGSSGS